MFPSAIEDPGPVKRGYSPGDIMLLDTPYLFCLGEEKEIIAKMMIIKSRPA
jgi:hypothetical protein